MKKTLGMLLALAILFGMMAACGKEEAPAKSVPPTAPAAATVDKTITVGTTYTHLYFYTAGSGESDNYCRRLIYDQIFYIDDNTGERASDILSGYEWVDDRTLKLSLKDGVLFSDGSKMTGEDILFTLKSYVDNGNAETEFFKRIDFGKSYVDKDGLTTYVVYSEVYGAALSTLCIPVLSKAFCQAHSDSDDAWWYAPVGSGPYKVGKVETGTSVEYVLRDDYWNKSAGYEAESITIQYYKDPTAEYADYLSGKLDVMLGLSDTQADDLAKQGNTKVVVQSANDVLMLAFNEKTVQPAVREAIACGVDWDAVAQAAFGSLYSPATGHFATTFTAYTDHGKVYTYDPDKAKKILKDAGISGLSFKFPCFGGSTDESVGEAMQFYFGEIGITLTIEPMDIPTLIPTLITGGGDVCLQSTAANGNAPKEVNTCISPLAAGGFAIMAISDAHFNDLLTQGLGTTDDAKRAGIYKQVDQWLYDNNQALPVCERAEAFCYNTDKLAGMSIASIQRGGIANVTFK